MTRLHVRSGVLPWLVIGCGALALAGCGSDDRDATPCTDQSACAATEACQIADGEAEGTCEPLPTCASTDDCEPTAACDEGAGVCRPLPTCTQDEDCALGEACASEHGVCKPAQVPDRPTGDAEPLFALDGAWSDTAFFDFPYPSDLRLDADGTAAVESLPNPIPEQTGGDLFAGLVETAGQLRGFSHVPVAWFRFSAALAARDQLDVIAGDKASPVLLLNIDPASLARGELIPTVAHTIEADDWSAEHVLGVAPRPGFVLRPETTYAFVIKRDIGLASGGTLAPPEGFWRLANRAIPQGARGQQAAEVYEPLWSALGELGVDKADVAVATVFTTGDAPADLFALSEQIRDRYNPQLTNLRVDPDDGAAHDRYCEVLADFEVPQFQRGEPPFDSEGLFELDDSGELIEQRKETIPVVFTFPKTNGALGEGAADGTMPPGGFPLVMYFHGSGGTHDQVINRGYQPPGGVPAKGEGPAHVLALHGFGAVGSAHPISPDRVPGASGIAYLNFNNLKMFRDLFRQGVIEQRLLLDALLELRVEPSVVAACGLSLPAGETHFRFRTDPVLAMGQSMGGQYTNLVGAVEPRIQAVVPTGAGGYWSWFILQTQLLPGIPTLVGGLLDTQAELTFMHPVLSVLQQAWEPVEPMVSMPRLGRRPLPGHPVRPVYEPVAQGDSYFPKEVFDAMVLAYGHQQAGTVQWTSMQDALALAGLDGLRQYPVVDNLASDDGFPFTGAVVQHEPDGFSDPHVIFVQLDEVKHQYGCFFETFARDGRAVVPAPAALGSACTTAP